MFRITQQINFTLKFLTRTVTKIPKKIAMGRDYITK